MTSARYSFDTSAFVNPWRRHYPRDVFPTLWKLIDQRIESGEIVATEEVREELKAKDDELLEYINEKTELFLPIDDEQQRFVTRILEKFPGLIDPLSRKNNADPFVMSLAMRHSLIVVTEEVNGGPKNLKIPYICREFNINCICFVDFVRRLDCKF